MPGNGRPQPGRVDGKHASRRHSAPADTHQAVVAVSSAPPLAATERWVSAGCCALPWRRAGLASARRRALTWAGRPCCCGSCRGRSGRPCRGEATFHATGKRSKYLGGGGGGTYPPRGGGGGGRGRLRARLLPRPPLLSGGGGPRRGLMSS